MFAILCSGAVGLDNHEIMEGTGLDLHTNGDWHRMRSGQASELEPISQWFSFPSGVDM